jgi:hypothetical protein
MELEEVVLEDPEGLLEVCGGVLRVDDVELIQEAHHLVEPLQVALPARAPPTMIARVRHTLCTFQSAIMSSQQYNTPHACRSHR